MHSTTVQRALNSKLDISCCIAAKKPFLTAKHIQKRKEWAKEHIGWTEQEFRCVIYTDESSVEIGKQSRQNTVWRKPGERYKKECLVPTFKSGCQSVMIWSCISYNMRGPLVRIPSGMCKGSDYVKLILDGPLWDIYLQQCEEKGIAIVMEDGAPTHRSAIAQNFRSQNSLETIPHPPQSPDMNPIEHVWKQLKVLINQRPTCP